MKKNIDPSKILDRVREANPVIHHLTNWVTIYDCAQVVKTLGASPVMAHAEEEVAEMTGIASALVLNIGTLTADLVKAMKIAAKSANQKGIPVVLDACGAGATKFRDETCRELLESVRIDMIKGNVSEIASVAGEKVRTQGVDAGAVGKDMSRIAGRLAQATRNTVVVTGKEDIVTDGRRTYFVRNGHPLMAKVVGTGCMAASVLGTFAAVEKDLIAAAVSGLVCFEIAAECAARKSPGPVAFKEKLFDVLCRLDRKTIERLRKFRPAAISA